MSNPRALSAPTGPICWLSKALLGGAIAASHSSPRRRVIQPFHRSESATLHRMFNAVQPDSYIPPHRHLDPPKAESWIVLRGKLAFFTFDEYCLGVGVKYCWPYWLVTAARVACIASSDNTTLSVRM